MLFSRHTREARARAKPCPVDFPADWRLSADDERFATERGFLPAQIADMALKFSNHYSTKGERRRDWSKAWPNWVLNERRPLYAIRGGKADPLRKARGFTEAEWRHKFTFLVDTWPTKHWGPAPGQAGCLVPETLQPKAMAILNQGLNKCMAQ